MNTGLLMVIAGVLLCFTGIGMIVGGPLIVLGLIATCAGAVAAGRDAVMKRGGPATSNLALRPPPQNCDDTAGLRGSTKIGWLGRHRD